MRLSALQEKKLLHLFAVYDRQRTGYLDRTDYELVAHGIATQRGYLPGSAEHEAITRTFFTQFARMREVADFSRDGKVAPDEWLDFFEMVLADELAFESVVTSTVDLVFALFDVDENALLDRGELARVRSGLGASVEDADALFEAMDRDGDGTLSAAEVRAAIEEFFRSDDPSAPGNGFFGPLAV